ncbi:hypothetical protein [Streptomyces mutabilis]|uniref:hypothetical protein n=2 Tax=Streptomyces mutabilis TaxID=67332 RepID=UPI0017823C36|nr:hypothetical protein [Streptomyces mutabilis]GGQ26054.1 hypothetical protein GCM10010279_37410 [Streptomyces mutabilis]
MRRSSWAALVAATVVMGMSTMSATASASVRVPPLEVVQCTGTENTTYSPGVLFQAREITLSTTGTFTSCLDATGQVASGGYGEQFTLFVGCNDLLGPFTGRRAITWNTGDTSVITGSGSSTAIAGQVITTFTGTVTQGPFQGSSAVQTITLPQLNTIKCLTTGITDATGITTLTLT